ncbi:MAG: hypothetical protein IJR50_02785 [Treponema sp.]|nr:hypothetical protein [Treponema sp.]
MKKLKFVISFAAFGFLLSFLFGLFSRSGIVRILLVALIFCAIFAVLGFVIQLLLDTILHVDNVQAASSVAIGSVAPKTGSHVDIVVQDEALPTDENAPQFFVGENHQMLNEEDYDDGSVHGFAKTQSDADSEKEMPSGNVDTIHELGNVASTAPIEKKTADGEGFVPVPLQETVQNMSSKEAGTSSSGIKKDETLDELPNFQDLQDLQTSSMSVDDIVEDSEFSSPPLKNKSAADRKFSENDTILMAKAISTALVKDAE